MTKKLPEDAHGLYEINMKIDVAKNADIILGNAEGDKVVMRYDTQKRTFSMDRRKSGIVDFSSDFPCITTAPISADHQQTLRLFIDRSSIEAFDGDGHFVMTNLVFPHQPYTTLSIHADGQGKVKDLVSWNIKY